MRDVDEPAFLWTTHMCLFSTFNGSEHQFYGSSRNCKSQLASQPRKVTHRLTRAWAGGYYARRYVRLLLPLDDEVEVGEELACLSSMMRAKSCARFWSSDSCC